MKFYAMKYGTENLDLDVNEIMFYILNARYEVSRITQIKPKRVPNNIHNTSLYNIHFF